VVPGAMAFPVHPNAAGEAGVAKVVQGAVAEALHPRSRSSSP
jgi:hypothetical protein